MSLTTGRHEKGVFSARLFSSDRNAPRRRRPSDVALLLVTAGVFFLLAWAAAGEPPPDQRAAELFADLPDWIRTLAWVGFTGAGLIVLGVLIAGLVGTGIGRGVYRDTVLALAIAVGLAFLGAWWTDGEWPLVLPEIFDPDVPTYPTLRVTFVLTVAYVFRPHVVRGIQILLRVAAVAVLLSPMLVGVSTFTGLLGAIFLSALSVAIVRVIFGSPEGLPTVSRLQSTLALAGIEATDVAYSPDQPGTVGLATATAADGTPLDIRVYGRDAADQQRAERIWRSLWYRPTGAAAGAGRVAQAEHEALALLAAARAGVPVPEVREVGATESGDVVLVTSRAEGESIGTRVDRGGPDTLDPEGARAAWRAVQALHRGRLSHGSIGPDTVMLTDGDAALTDFRMASLMPTEAQYAADGAALLGCTAVMLGADDAIDIAVEEAGDDIADLLPFVQDAVVAPDLRRWLGHNGVKLTKLRKRAAEHLGVDAPDPAELRRISWGDVVMIVFAIIAANALIGQIAEVGWDVLVEELQSASAGWVVVAFLIKLAGYSFAVIGLRAVLGRAIPFAPTWLLQSSKSFVGLVVPSAVGRVSMDVLFLQKMGVSTTAALTQGPVISLIGFSAEVVLLLVSAWAIGQELETDGLLDINVGGLLAIAAIVVIIGVVVVLVVPSLRAKVIPPLKEAVATLRDMVRSPKALAQIFTSETLERLFNALALGAVVAAFGEDLPFAALVFVAVGTGLLAGLAPVPGGIGVAEATMTALLTAVGIPSETAFSIAIVYRVATAYLPPVLGFFSMRLLQRDGYI